MAALNLHAMICIIGLTMAIHIPGKEAAVVVPKKSHYGGNEFLAGYGYSRDTQQLTSQECYNVIKTSTSEQQSYVKLSQALSSSELESDLGLSVSLSGSYDEFSAEASASYARSFIDNDYAISLNYYEYSSNQVTVQLMGSGNTALTTTGQSFYANGTNPYFGMVCGDHYISSYRQGALLTMGLYIEFSSSVEKTKFEEEAGVSFGGIMSASESVKKANSKRRFEGSLSIQAFQMGGEPSKLSEIFNKASTGDYYVMTCSLTAIDQCEKAASGLLDYATSNFPNQFSFEKNTGLTPLGMAFLQFQPIKWIGLTPPVSLVTLEVEKCRKKLSNKLRENEYYRQRLYPFLNNGYPVELVDDFVRNVSSLSSVVSKNLLILMRSHSGAADCYNSPETCENTKANIDSQLKDITIGDLTFLNVIKYMLTINTAITNAIWYNKGKDSRYLWDIVYPQPNGDESNQPKQVKEITVSSEMFFFSVQSSNGYWGHDYNGYPQSNLTYYGLFFNVNPANCSYATAYKKISPWFFELYNINTDDATNDPDAPEHQVQNRNKIRLNVVVSNLENRTMPTWSNK